MPGWLWHGDKDVFSPIGHTLWLADRIENATLVVQCGTSHFGAVVVLPDVLRWLLAEHTDEFSTG